MRFKDEKGEVMIESTYCVFAVIVVFFLMFSLGFFLYQHIIFEIVTNEVAEEVIQVYKFKEAEHDGDISASDVDSIPHVRYLFAALTGSYDKAAETRIKKLAKERLKATSFAVAEGDLDVTVKTDVHCVGRRHYIVTLSQDYSFFLGGLLEIVGQDAKRTITASTCIESMDVSHYINTVRFTDYMTGKLSGVADGVTGIVSAAESIIKLFAQIFTV